MLKYKQIFLMRITLLLCATILAWLSTSVLVQAQTTSSHFQISNQEVSGATLSGTSSAFTLDPARGAQSTSPSFTLSGHSKPLQTPKAPTLTNDNRLYNKLHITLDARSNDPDDLLYAVIISLDNWETFHTISPESTPGASGVIPTEQDFHTRAFWGDADGTMIFDLTPDTVYRARVAVWRPGSTQSRFSPDSKPVATDVLSVRMSVTRNSSDFFILNTQHVARTSEIALTVSTNNESGYYTFIRDEGNGVDGGLFDPARGALIASDDRILAPGIPGYGAQAYSPSAHVHARYNHTGSAIGGLATDEHVLSSNTVPVTDESTFVTLHASIDGDTSAGNYVDTIYYTAAAAL